MAASGLA